VGITDIERAVSYALAIKNDSMGPKARTQAGCQWMGITDFVSMLKVYEAIKASRPEMRNFTVLLRGTCTAEYSIEGRDASDAVLLGLEEAERDHPDTSWEVERVE
jgi:hypothetical protein